MVEWVRRAPPHYPCWTRRHALGSQEERGGERRPRIDEPIARDASDVRCLPSRIAARIGDGPSGTATCARIENEAQTRSTIPNPRAKHARRARNAMSAHSSRASRRRWIVGSDAPHFTPARIGADRRGPWPFCAERTQPAPRMHRDGLTRSARDLVCSRGSRAVGHGIRRAHGASEALLFTKDRGVRLARRLHSPTHPLAGSCGCASAFATSRSPARSNPREPRGPPT